MVRELAIVVSLVGPGVLSGCGADRDAAAAAATTQFYTAIADHDGAAACRLLAPPTRQELASSAPGCAEGVLSELQASTGDPEVVVSGSGAQVRVGDDTVFLAEYAAGWLVVAAGCAPPPFEDVPYDCRVGG